MIRVLLATIGYVCTGTVIAALLGVGYLSGVLQRAPKLIELRQSLIRIDQVDDRQELVFEIQIRRKNHLSRKIGIRRRLGWCHACCGQQDDDTN